MITEKITNTLRSLNWVLVLFLIQQSVNAQNCNISIAETAPNSRFQDNGDGTVTDLRYNLMWKRCSEELSGNLCETSNAILSSGSPTDFVWQDGLAHIEHLNGSGGFAQHTDWRLPNRKELESLLELACNAPAINLSIFPNTPNSFYWSSSRFPSNTSFVWGVDFTDGLVFPSFSTQAPIRLVRDIQ